ncbi:hypothetical protein [Desertivibrio insolitus]|uniref:hypothetical protein n=1 Tax=Herbiconiux sp. SYSU D00978 TaxID=2812562 RepID=UPI001A966AA4|nr:hypothetical protein [Herbiconiux sp. SYSU D00978]
MHLTRTPTALTADRLTAAPLHGLPGAGARLGLGGLLAERGHRMRRARRRGTAVTHAFRWRWRDVWSQVWWPQGIAIGEHDGRPVALVSWFAQKRGGVERGSRISVVDLSDPRRPRYRHVLLVEPVVRSGSVALEPVVVHAGGLAWVGGSLLVAATFGGIREFVLDDVVPVPAPGLFGHRYVLPQTARATQPEEGERMRYSFLASVGEDVTAGEYRKDERGRLVRLVPREDGFAVEGAFAPGIREMQGAVLHEGRWHVTASRGDKQNGDLWTGPEGALERMPGALPPGPEDIAVWPERGELWSVTEFPWKRWLYSVSLPGDQRARAKSTR